MSRWPPSAVFESTPKKLLGLPSDPDSLGGARGNAQVVAEALVTPMAGPAGFVALGGPLEVG